MKVYTSSVTVGKALGDSGCLYEIDWETGTVQNKMPIPNSVFPNPGPRGSKRGGRGICIWNNEVVLATYDSLHFYSPELVLQRSISNELYCGIHEIVAAEEGIWISSTGIEAVILINPVNGEVIRKHVIPHIDGFTQSAPFVPKRNIDLNGDFSSFIYSRSEMATHVNCVSPFDGNTYALLSNLGAVVQLEPKSELILQDVELQQPHNIVFANGKIISNNSGQQTGNIYDLESNKLERKIDLNKLSLKMKKLGSILKGMIKISTLGWLRSMAIPRNNSLLVGIFPFGISEVDLSTDKLIKTVKLSDYINNSIHGLCTMDACPQ